jgi:hypothetical protein
MSQTELTPADLREDVSPVSERFAAFTLGSALVIFDRDDSERWICSETTVSRDEMR